MSGQKKYKPRRAFRHEDGSITVEFVVTFPLILAALAFSFEFGRLFIAHHTAVNNVRAAVRYLSRSNLDASNLQVAQNIVRTGLAAGGGLPPWVDSSEDVSVQITPADSTFSDDNFRVSGQTIRIQTTVNYHVSIASFLGLGGNDIPIIITEDIRHIGE